RAGSGAPSSLRGRSFPAALGCGTFLRWNNAYACSPTTTSRTGAPRGRLWRPRTLPMPSAELPQFALTLAQDARSEEAGRVWGAVEAAAAFIPGGPWPRDADALEGQLLAIADAPFERG